MDGFRGGIFIGHCVLIKGRHITGKTKCTAKTKVVRGIRRFSDTCALVEGLSSHDDGVERLFVSNVDAVGAYVVRSGLDREQACEHPQAHAKDEQGKRCSIAIVG